MRFLLLCALGLAAVAAAPPKSPKIIGGSVTTIDQYPYSAPLLWVFAGIISQFCGSTIINNRSLLTAAHCFDGGSITQYRTRVGSSYASSGGTVHTLSRVIGHPAFDKDTLDNDVAVVHISGTFFFNNNVAPASIAGPNYNVPDNAIVWAIGWGRTSVGGSRSEQLRHVQIWTVNQAICKSRYAEVGYAITDGMLCAGWLDVGGRDQCHGDSGSPLIHNNVIVGVCSFGEECALPRYPGVNARVSTYSSWIQSNA